MSQEAKFSVYLYLHSGVTNSDYSIIERRVPFHSSCPLLFWDLFWECSGSFPCYYPVLFAARTFRHKYGLFWNSLHLREPLIFLFVFLSSEDFDSPHSLFTIWTSHVSKGWPQWQTSMFFLHSLSLCGFCSHVQQKLFSMFVEDKNSLQGTLDPSCAYGEDQAGRNE